MSERACAGHHAELVALGGARLDSERVQRVTVGVAPAKVRIVAEVTGDAPALVWTLQHLDGEGDTAHCAARR